MDDIRRFVSGLSVEVISCFDTNPRRRRGQETSTDRKAFRLGINDQDRDRLLDASSWPDSVLISEWFFRGRDERFAVDNRTSETRCPDITPPVETP